VKLFAVIPTVGDRNDTLLPMVKQLSLEGVTPIIIHNRRDWTPLTPDEPLLFQHLPIPPYVQHHVWQEDEPVNLSWVWNEGLRWADELAEDQEYMVAIFNDDLTLPPGLVHEFARKMNQDGSSIVYAHPTTDLPTMTDSQPWHLGNRMVGYAFALRGWDHLYADEDFLWWWGDSDLDWRARGKRGVSALAVPTLQHHDPNGYTNRNPELYAQAGRDRETFHRNHGFLPW
jgi:hypothetical protein